MLYTISLFYCIFIFKCVIITTVNKDIIVENIINYLILTHAGSELFRNHMYKLVCASYLHNDNICAFS